jgi:anaerobic selenocysteine-containing dehydrogenase
VGFEAVKAQVEKQDWDLLEGESGTTRQEMRRFAEMLRDAKNGIFVWSMGLTQHAHGVETIEALINVSLARGWVGRERTGLYADPRALGCSGGSRGWLCALVGGKPTKTLRRRVEL